MIDFIEDHVHQILLKNSIFSTFVGEVYYLLKERYNSKRGTIYHMYVNIYIYTQQSIYVLKKQSHVQIYLISGIVDDTYVSDVIQLVFMAPLIPARRTHRFELKYF